MSNFSIERLLTECVKRNASLMHLVPGEVPILRVQSEMIKLEQEAPLSVEDLQRLSSTLLDNKQQEELQEGKSFTLAHAFDNGIRTRIHFFRQEGKLSGVVKIIPAKLENLTELGWPETIHRILDKSRGLVIIAGAVNSGRTTTWASLINAINQQHKKHIVTLEQSIEYLLADNQSVIEQRKVSQETNLYLEALKASAQEDVDVLAIDNLVEEAAIIKTVLHIAKTNSLVFVTMNAKDSTDALEKFIYSFRDIKEQAVAKSLLADSLLAVLAQDLVKGAAGELTLLYEILFNNQSVKNLINEGKFKQIVNTMQIAREEGMITLGKCREELKRGGKISG